MEENTDEMVNESGGKMVLQMGDSLLLADTQFLYNTNEMGFLAIQQTSC